MALSPHADTPAHLLVVDDDDRIRTLLQRYLTGLGYSVTTANDAKHARKLMDALSFDLIILDVMMPGENGVSLTRAVRWQGDTPIILLTARGDTPQRIEGLSAGADDYLAKPFEPEELALRVGAILKRARPAPAAYVLNFGSASWHHNRDELRRDGVLVRLTDTEKDLLRVFAARPGATITREELARKAGVAIERSIDVQVTRLRRKLEDDPAEPVYLQTVRGLGYRLIHDA
ncbi:response regulator [Candidatus Phycosocius spiralis]|uniref:DNA-binding response regulator n=1 Tax=Candidatus Phycosocius spiralis TaxID=2815099 RepID=A0ABQ4PX23_9PROT|nr:response regulator [Candidatus Phycosocius spiralis]GIU67501.1 DNA-binding response regulator [Candidatus Phycosocius spiralis]